MPDLMQEPPFLLKLVDLTCTSVGCYYFSQICCYKIFLHNIIAYSIFFGGLISIIILISSYVSENKNSFHENAILTIYGLLNLIGAYIFYTKIKSCQCTGNINPEAAMAVCSGLTGVSMLGEILSDVNGEETEKKEEINNEEVSKKHEEKPKHVEHEEKPKHVEHEEKPKHVEHEEKPKHVEPEEKPKHEEKPEPKEEHKPEPESEEDERD